MARTTGLVTEASGTTLDNGVRFPGEFFIIVDASALGLVLNFESLAYVADCYGKLHSLDGTALMGNEFPAPPPPLGLFGADLEVLA